MKKFFCHIQFALSEATQQAKKFEKSGDVKNQQMWLEIHRLLTHTCAKIQDIQYKKINH